MRKLYLLLIGLTLVSCTSNNTSTSSSSISTNSNHSITESDVSTNSISSLNKIYTYREIVEFEKNINVTINGTNIPFRVQDLGLQRMGEGWAWPAIGNNFFEELSDEYRNNDYDFEILDNNILKFESSIFSSYYITEYSYRFNGYFNDETHVWEKIDLSSERKDNSVMYSLPYLEDYEGYFIEIALTFPLDEESAFGYKIGAMVVF